MAAKNPSETKLDDNVTEPATTAPGDAPADTTDPSERASTVVPQPSPEALMAGTVNAVAKMPDIPAAPVVKGGERVETYEAVRPDGTKVTVEHDLDTGATRIV